MKIRRRRTRQRGRLEWSGPSLDRQLVGYCLRMLLTMIVEIPKGSRNKYEMDHATGELFLDRMLFTATRTRPTTGSSPRPSPKTATRSTHSRSSPSQRFQGAGSAFVRSGVPHGGPGPLGSQGPLCARRRSPVGHSPRHRDVPAHLLRANSSTSLRSTRISRTRRPQHSDGVRSRRPRSSSTNPSSDGPPTQRNEPPGQRDVVRLIAPLDPR